MSWEWYLLININPHAYKKLCDVMKKSIINFRDYSIDTLDRDNEINEIFRPCWLGSGEILKINWEAIRNGMDSQLNEVFEFELRWGKAEQILVNRGPFNQYSEPLFLPFYVNSTIFFINNCNITKYERMKDICRASIT